MSAHCCPTEPCPGRWACHYQCATADPEDQECECHCRGKYHGKGWEALNARPSIGDRVKRRRTRKNLAGMSDDELAGHGAHIDWENTNDVAAFMSELDRRDTAAAEQAKQAAKDATKAERKAAARAKRHGIATEWALTAEAQYLAAEEATNGHMLSKAGERAGFDPKKFWVVNERTRRRYASEEANEWFDGMGKGKAHPPTTLGEYNRQAAAARRDDREAAVAVVEAQHGAYAHVIEHPDTWATMRRQDFDTSEPLSLIDAGTVRAGQPTTRPDDAAGTPDMFSAEPEAPKLSRESREEVDRYAHAVRGMTREKLRRAVEEHERLLRVTAPGGGSGVTWTPEHQAEERAKLATAREELADREKLG
jgi:hypothetical protein